MPAVSFPPSSADIAVAQGRSRSWLFALGGMMAGGFAVLAIYAVVTAPAGLLIGLAWQNVAPAKPIQTAFDSHGPLKAAQVLYGVSGEAVGPDAPRVEVAALSTTILDGTQLTPVALDRLSSGDCISLTTASGQKLSFRIVGAQKSEVQRGRSGSSKIDLAVTPCSTSSDVILKAVIEKAQTKESAVQRNL